jgi:membrane protease YdiL (CAAX protease family)
MLFVGAAEEIAARGVYLRLLAPWGPGLACVLSGTVFGLSHIGNALFFNQSWAVTTEMMVVALLFGTVYAALRLRVEALWPLVLLHAVNNTAEYASVQPPPLWFKVVVGAAALGYAWWLLRPVTHVIPPHRASDDRVRLGSPERQTDPRG